MRTPLGPTQSVRIRGVSLFQGLFNMHKVRLGLHAVAASQWMAVFQVCPQGRVPLWCISNDAHTHTRTHSCDFHFAECSPSISLPFVCTTRID